MLYHYIASLLSRYLLMNLTKYKELVMECGCGRSPSGKCCGWHALSEEEYQKELAKLRKGKTEEEINEDKD